MNRKLKAYSRVTGVLRRLSRGRLGRFPLVIKAKARFERALLGGDSVTMEVDGYTMRVPTDGVSISSATAYGSGDFESYMGELFVDALEPGDVVVDVGASVGHYTLRAARAVGPTGRVFAVEPAPHDFEVLVDNVRLNGFENVVEIPKAAVARSGPQEFFVADRPGFHSLIPKALDDLESHRIPVDGVSVDELVQGADVNVAKIDVEGSEPAVLEGMLHTIERSERFVMFVEFNPSLIAAGGQDPERFLDRLSELGMEAHVIDEKERALKPVAHLRVRGDDGEPLGEGCNLMCRKTSAFTGSV